MPVEPVRIGIVDSGFTASRQVVKDAAFTLRDDRLWLEDCQPDQLGHGSRIIEIMEALAPECEIISAQVFRDRFTTTAAQVGAAIDWLVDQKVQVINLSLGLRQDRSSLRDACQRAIKHDVILCAASPARGEPVFPASYPGVFRMTGDARCARDEISHLNTRFADFGACVKPMDMVVGLSGASLGCAHLTAHLANFLQTTDRANPDSARTWLHERARYHGPEQKRYAND